MYILNCSTTLQVTSASKHRSIIHVEWNLTLGLRNSKSYYSATSQIFMNSFNSKALTRQNIYKIEINHTIK